MKVTGSSPLFITSLNEIFLILIYSNNYHGREVSLEQVNIAMVVAIDGGLITPTLHNVNERDVSDLSEEWPELLHKAESGTLSTAAHNLGTFTISNLGMFGVSDVDAILPIGQGGILAVAAMREVIVPDTQAILGMKRVQNMKVTLTCDHRHIDGAEAALFLRTLADIVENQTSRRSR